MYHLSWVNKSCMLVTMERKYNFLVQIMEKLLLLLLHGRYLYPNDVRIVGRWCCVSNTLHRGQRDTRLCPDLVISSLLYYSLTLSQRRSLPIFPHQCSLPSSSAAAAIAALSLAPTRSIHSCSHHRIPTLTPSFLSFSSHRSRTDHVAMNCLTIFYQLQMYSSVALNPASSLAAASEVYSHFPLLRLLRSLPVNWRATCSWNPPRTRLMQGVTNRVSAPKSSTNCNTALKKNMDTRGASPSLMIILVNLRHTFAPYPGG